MTPELTQALEISRRDLLGNIAAREWQGPTRLKRAEIVLAGRTKFTEAWARDAAFAVPALLSLGRVDAVRNTLEAFYDLQHRDGRLPRRLSGMGNAARNLRAGLAHWLGLRLESPERIHPEFLTSGPRLLWYRGRPKDVNPLLLIATAAYHRTGVDPAFAGDRREPIQRALAYLRRHEEEALLHQHHFEDWEDHTKHWGHGLYTNVLYHRALVDLAAMDDLWSRQARADLLAHAARVAEGLQRFWLEEDGYFAHFLGPRFRRPPFSLPGNMLAITCGVATAAQRRRILEQLERVVATLGYVPIAAPGYPLRFTSPLRAPFVRHYLSGRLLLPWLQLLAARAAVPTHPHLARALTLQVARPVVRYGRSLEALYEGRAPLRYVFTAQEHHFTWGSAALHETCETLARAEHSGPAVGAGRMLARCAPMPGRMS